MKTRYVVIISVCVLAVAILYFVVSSREVNQNFGEYNKVKSEENVTEESEIDYDSSVYINGWTEQDLHNVYDVCSFGCDEYMGSKYDVCTRQTADVIAELESITGTDAVIFHTVDMGTYEADGIVYYCNCYSITFDYNKVFYVYEDYGSSYMIEADNDYDTLVEYYETGDISVLN